MTERVYIALCLNSLLGDFKRHIRVTSDDMDADLHDKLLASVEAAEHQIGRVLVQSRFTLFTDCAASVRLKAPIVNVESVEVDGVAVADYTVKGNILSVKAQGNRLKVVYVSGGETMPFDVKAAILMHAATLFNNPTDSVETLAKASDNLLRAHRNYGEDDGE